MKCPNCGKEIAEKSKFCEFCGTEIVKPKKSVPVRMIVEIVLAIIVIGLGVSLYIEHQHYEARRETVEGENDSIKVALNLTDAEKSFAEAKSKMAEAEKEVLKTRTALEAAKVELRKIEEEATQKHVAMDYTENVLDVNMRMVWVEGGTFGMGDNSSSLKTRHEVTLDGFYIGMFEVKQGQWEKIMKNTIKNQQEKYSPGVLLNGEGYEYPMYYVTWFDAKAFCDALSNISSNKYSLPSEAQWEYAARGGRNETSTTYAGSDNADFVAWYDNNSKRKTHPCGSKQPNELGIFDMSGNVEEWCNDWYGSYDTLSVKNPIGKIEGDTRVVRGGTWGSIPFSSVYSRCSRNPNTGNHLVGFRVVCNPTKEQKNLYNKLERTRLKVKQAENNADEAKKKAHKAYRQLDEATKNVKEFQKEHIKTCPEGYVDLGLPSGTIWKKTNENGRYTFDEALEKFGYYLPTNMQLFELREQCQWHRVDSGNNIVGPSGDSIFLPASGCRNRADGKIEEVGKNGSYWSCTPYSYEEAWELVYGERGYPSVKSAYRSWEQSIRLVK